MIGSAWEWTDEWMAAVGDGSTALLDQPVTPASGAMDPWPDRAAYNDDRTWNIQSSVATRVNGAVLRGMPSAAIRGGGYSVGSRAGVFAVALNYGPSFWSQDTGFRCVISR